MSLILEALRKLEREKQTPARGVVVLGGMSAPGAQPQVRPLLLFLLGLSLGGAALTAVLWRRAPAAPAPQPAAASPTQPATRPATPPSQPPPPEPAPRRLAAAQAAPSAEAEAAAAPAVSLAPAPTAAPSLAPSQPFTLQAVSERDGRAVAIINDRLLREGDSIDGARIVKIASDQVELEIGGRRVVLRF